MHPEAITSRQKKLFDKLKSFQDYYLAGGTALALQIGHRISVDFDFFSRTDIPKELFSQVKRIFSSSQPAIIVNHKEQLTIDIDGVNLTFVRYAYPPLFKLKEYKDIKLLSVPEIAVAKAYVLGRRATYKDYIDLYFILKEEHSTLSKIIKIAEEKYKQEFNARLFLEQLIYLDDIEDVEITFLKHRATRKELQKFFEGKISQYKI